MTREDQYISLYAVIVDDKGEVRPYLGRAVTYSDAVLMARGLLTEYPKICIKDKNDRCEYVVSSA